MPTLYLYILDTFSDWETGHALAELHSGRYLKDPALKYDVVLCGRTMDTITTMGGLRMTPYTLIESIRPGNADILILSGADLWLDPEQKPVLAKVADLLAGGTVVAAICGATLGLANAGMLDTRPHTSNDLGALRMFCPNYRGEQFYRAEPAVTDNNLITASGLAPVEFACHIFRKLGVMHPATLDAWHGLFTTRKPEYFYALMASLPGQQKGELRDGAFYAPGWIRLSYATSMEVLKDAMGRIRRLHQSSFPLPFSRPPRNAWEEPHDHRAPPHRARPVPLQSTLRRPASGAALGHGLRDRDRPGLP